jgi:hypothetical protein
LGQWAALSIPRRLSDPSLEKARHVLVSEMHAKDHEELHLSSLHLPCGSGPQLLIASVLLAPCSFLRTKSPASSGIKPVLKKVAVHVTDVASALRELQWMWLIQYCKGRLDASLMNTFEDHNCIEIRENSTPGTLYFSMQETSLHNVTLKAAASERSR